MIGAGRQPRFWKLGLILMSQDGTEHTANHDNGNQNGHNDLYHWVYVALPTGLIGIADYIFLYPENHLLAFLLLGAWISLVLVYELHKIGYSQSKIATVVLTVMVASVALAAIVGPAHLPDVEAVGLLSPANDPAAPTCGGVPPNSVTMVIARNRYISPPDTSKFTPVKIGSCAPITIFKDNNKIYINGEIRNLENKLIGTLNNNEFRAIVGDASYIERDGELSTLVVYERMVWLRLLTFDKEILRIRYDNVNTISASGSFTCNNGPIVFLDKNGDVSINGKRFASITDNCFLGSGLGLQIGNPNP